MNIENLEKKHLKAKSLVLFFIMKTLYKLVNLILVFLTVCFSRSPERRDEETTDILSDTEDMDDETRPLLAKLENATIQQNGTVTREVQ